MKNTVLGLIAAFIVVLPLCALECNGPDLTDPPPSDEEIDNELIIEAPTDGPCLFSALGNTYDIRAKVEWIDEENGQSIPVAWTPENASSPSQRFTWDDTTIPTGPGEVTFDIKTPASGKYSVQVTITARNCESCCEAECTPAGGDFVQGRPEWEGSSPLTEYQDPAIIKTEYIAYMGCICCN